MADVEERTRVLALEWGWDLYDASHGRKQLWGLIPTRADVPHVHGWFDTLKACRDFIVGDWPGPDALAFLTEKHGWKLYEGPGTWGLIPTRADVPHVHGWFESREDCRDFIFTGHDPRPKAGSV